MVERTKPTAKETPLSTCYCPKCYPEDFNEWAECASTSDVQNALALHRAANRRSRNLLTAAKKHLTVETYSALIEICDEGEYGCLREVWRFIWDYPKPIRLDLE